MEDYDLTGVDPMRRPETRRRITAIRTFLTICEPSETDWRRHAAMLGLGLTQFRSLVSAWQQRRKANDVPGSGIGKGVRRDTGPRHLPPGVMKTTAGALESLPPRARLVDACQAVAEACAEADVEPPSIATVRKMLLEAQRRRPSPEDVGVLVVGMCRVRLPTLAAGGLEMPELAIAVRAEDGVIMAATMVADPPRSGALVGLAVAMPGLARVHVDETLIEDAATIAAATTLFEPPSAIRRRLSRILGDRIDEVRIVLKSGAEERPERFLRARKDQPLSPEDAQAVVREAIDAENAARGGARAIWIG